jgi:hypothetical protein
LNGLINDDGVESESVCLFLFSDTMTVLSREIESIDARTRKWQSEFTQALQEMEAMQHDGKFLWPIENVYRKRQEAMAGTDVSLQSPPFYTSKTGMYLRATRLSSECFFFIRSL